MRRALVIATAVGLVASALSGCGRDSLDLAFQPPVGTRVVYETTSLTRTQTDVPGTAPDVDQRSVLRIEQNVISAAGTSVLIGVTATFISLSNHGLAGETPEPVVATYRVDREGHSVNTATTTVTAVDFIRQGLPEITAPFPSERVRPGQEWAFTPPAGRSGFGGKAKLVRLGQREGVRFAHIESTLRVVLDDTEIRGRDGPVTIGGPLTLRLRGDYDIETGLLLRSHEELTGEFRLRFTQAGSNLPPRAGSQTLTVVNETRRVSPDPVRRA